MPVEIRELIIRTTIVDNNSDDNNNNPQVDSGGNEAIIATCVAQVLKILERKRER